MEYPEKARDQRKEGYLAFAAATGLPVFMQPHWLDIVCRGGEWGVCLSHDNEGRIDAVMPYFLKQKLGIRYLTMPVLTPFLGIWFRPDDQLSDRKLLSRRNHQLEALIDQLPGAQWHQQRLHHSLESWLPFYWNGYGQEAKYTFILKDCSDPEAIFGNFSSGLRQRIRQAQEAYSVITDQSSETAFRVVSGTLQDKGAAKGIDLMMLQQIDQALSERNQRKVYLAKTPDGNSVAAVYIVRDAFTCYNLLNGRIPDEPIGGAVALLLWEAIKDAGKSGLSFDFEGSMLPGVHEFFRSFGGELVAQSYVYKFNGWARVLRIFT